MKMTKEEFRNIMRMALAELDRQTQDQLSWRGWKGAQATLRRNKYKRLIREEFAAMAGQIKDHELQERPYLCGSSR